MLFAFLVIAAVAPDDPSKYAIADPSQPQRIDYLIVTGDAFGAKLDRLAEHRSKDGYRVGIVTMEKVKAQFEDLRSFLAHTQEKWKAPAPQFLLLVGDVDHVPAMILESQYKGPGGEIDLATDFEYACPQTEFQIALHVGRFPCDNASELEVMIDKTVRYETELADGAWQKKIAVVAGAGGYGEQIDRMLEQLFMEIFSKGLPPRYDLEIAYANPQSPYCVYPPAFQAHALGMLNEGSLFYVFVGHGAKSGVDRLRWKQKSFEILNDSHKGELNVSSGLPIMVVIACSTGEYDTGGSDCVGENFFKQPHGPVAFVGGSRVTTPYGNGVLGERMARHLGSEIATLGELLSATKASIIKHEPSPTIKSIDFMATMFFGENHLQGLREDVVRHYNLIGDPALRIRRPKHALELSVDAAGVLHVEAPESVDQVTITVEIPREEYQESPAVLDPTDPEFEKKSLERYRKVNDKVVRSYQVQLKDGHGKTKIEGPPPGFARYYIKAHAPGYYGCTPVSVEAVTE